MSGLRDYQIEALSKLNSFYTNGGHSGGVSLPTGTGKTRIMIAQADAESQDRSDNRRVAVLVDRDVLVEQTEKALRALLPPSTSIGVVKAHRNELGARVLVISIHTMRSTKRLAQVPPLKLVIVDEAHMSVSPTYKRFFEHVGANQPGGARLSGFSATWTRSDGTGLGDIWQEIVFSRTIKWGIDRGILVKPRAIQVGEGVDLDDVRTKGRNGDYREDDLGRAVMLEELRDNMVEGVRKHGFDRHGRPRPGVLFAPTVEAAEYFGDALREAGIPTEGIYGTVAGGERRTRHDRHRSGETRILTTCTALAVGWDFPPASLGILARPVRHEGLFVQMVGRLLRTSKETGKEDALLLDMVRATDDVRLRNAVDLSKTVQRDDKLIEMDDTEPEPVTRERIVIRRKRSYEVEIVAGASVRWLTGPSGIPFIPIPYRGLMFVVEDVSGFHVAHYDGKKTPTGEPIGRFIASGLSQADALDFAAIEAEELGARDKPEHWRSGAPTRDQDYGIRKYRIQDAEFMTRGELQDRIEIEQSRWVLGYFARWSAARMATLSSRVDTPFGPALAGTR